MKITRIPIGVMGMFTMMMPAGDIVYVAQEYAMTKLFVLDEGGPYVNRTFNVVQSEFELYNHEESWQYTGSFFHSSTGVVTHVFELLEVPI